MVTPRKKTAPAAPPPPAPPTPTDDDLDAVEFTQQLIDRHPPLTDVQAVTYAAQCADDVADALGRETVSDHVAADARRALRRGERMLLAYPQAIAYKLRRLVYLAHCQRDLERKIAQQKGQRATVAATPAEAEAALRVARTSLVTALDETLEGNEDFATKLAALHGDVHEPRALLDATTSAVRLAREVLAKHDPGLDLLAEDCHLTEGSIDAAARAGRALQQAIDGKPDARTRGDTPEVNRAEGRVLFELRRLKRALDQAHAKNGLVERYVPSAPLRRVLGGRTQGQPSTETQSTDPGAAPPAPAAAKPATP